MVNRALTFKPLEIKEGTELEIWGVVVGKFDYLCKARLRGMGQYRHLLGNILKKGSPRFQCNK